MKRIFAKWKQVRTVSRSALRALEEERNKLPMEGQASKVANLKYGLTLKEYDDDYEERDEFTRFDNYDAPEDKPVNTSFIM